MAKCTEKVTARKTKIFSHLFFRFKNKPLWSRNCFIFFIKATTVCKDKCFKKKHSNTTEVSQERLFHCFNDMYNSCPSIFILAMHNYYYPFSLN